MSLSILLCSPEYPYSVCVNGKRIHWCKDTHFLPFRKYFRRFLAVYQKAIFLISPVSVVPGPISVNSIASQAGTPSSAAASAAIFLIVSVHFTAPVNWARRLALMVSGSVVETALKF